MSRDQRMADATQLRRARITALMLRSVSSRAKRHFELCDELWAHGPLTNPNPNSSPRPCAIN